MEVSQCKKMLVSFYPLCCNKNGRKAIEEYGLMPYVDGSCRREPDFENQLPCITGLCRPDFVKKLVIGDEVAYVTNKRGVGARKLVAILKVFQIFKNHNLAAKWYISNKIPVPNNIIVSETCPFPLDKTHQKGSWKGGWGSSDNLSEWDALYKKRSDESSEVAQCEIIYLNLEAPKNLDESKFNRPLCAQNPPKLSSKEWKIILENIKNEQQ